MRQALITRLVSDALEVSPEADAQALDQKFTATLSAYHVEHTGTEVAIVEQFPRAAQDYLTSRAIEGLSKSTLKMYHKVLVRFFNEVQVDFARLDAVPIKVWIYGLQQSGIKDTTVKLYVGVVKTFLKWCADNDICAKDPARQVKAPRAERHYKEPLSREDMTAVREACTTDRERAVIELLYSTGCRVGELVTTHVSDINLANGEIRMRNWKSHKDKTVFISETCAFWLRRWLPQCSSEAIIPSRKGGRNLTIAGVERMVAIIGERAGLRTRLTPHILRHTLATDIVSNGGSLADAQKILDHKSPTTTLIYAKFSERQLQEVHRRCAA